MSSKTERWEQHELSMRIRELEHFKKILKERIIDDQEHIKRIEKDLRKLR